MRLSKMGGRLARASATLGLMAAVLALAHWAPGKHLAPVGAPGAMATGAEEAGQALLEGQGLDEVLAGQGYRVVSAAEAPAWFAEEGLPIREGERGWATSDWSVVGVVRSGSPGEAIEEALGQLVGRGWSICDSGFDGVATLLKEEGEARWMMMQCAQVGDAASLVVQTQRSSC